ncbi:hypothetical protein VTL71DRAFT_5017 [Oculimacula yallundae]|uniref:Uncharacterized protein n=1 Tax=Oculimacula yallundae TaxID=86028 RepID=A0ABR4BZY0_9HELO
MGSGSSRLETRWWEAEAQRKVVTTKNSGKVEVICSLIPGVDEIAMVGYLKERSDLDTLFALHCRHQNLSSDQRVDPPALTVDFKANELWRLLRMPPGYGEAPWDWNWHPPLEGIPSEIATEFHTTVCQAIFRIPFSDFVKCALRYSTKAHFLKNLVDAVYDVRDNLRTEYQDRPGIQGIYVEALKQRHHPLAHWIVASSLNQRAGAPYNAFATNFDQIKSIFLTRDFNVVLKRLTAFDLRFAHGSQMYNWQKWSTNLDFWQCVDDVIWSGKFTTPFMPPHLSSEHRDERLRFLEEFETAPEDKARSNSSGVIGFMKKLIVWERGSRGQNSRHTIKRGLLVSGLASDKFLKHSAMGLEPGRDQGGDDVRH